MKPRLAVLDMVGTTVEAGPEVSQAFLGAFARKGIRLSEAEVSHVRGRSKRDAVSELVAANLPDSATSEQWTEEIHTAFRSLLRVRCETASRPVPGARAALDELARRGVQVVLTTGLDRDTADQIVRGLGWESAGLRGVVTADDVERGRPAPDLIRAAMALADEHDASAVVAVGDTVSDLQAAAAAAVGWSIGVLSGAHERRQLEAHPHSVLLESVAELPGWLSREGRSMSP